MRPVQQLDLTNFKTAESRAIATQISDKIIAYAVDAQILILQNASGMLLSILQLPRPVSAMATTTYAAKPSLVIGTPEQIVCYSFLSLQPSLSSFKYQLEFSFDINNHRESQPIQIKFCDDIALNYLGVIVFNNNTAYVLDLRKKRFTFNLCGIPLASQKIVELIQGHSGACQCAQRFDQFTDLLDSMNLAEIGEFLSREEDTICKRCQQNMINGYLGGRVVPDEVMCKSTRRKSKGSLERDYQDKKQNECFPFYSIPHIFGAQAVTSLEEMHINLQRKALTMQNAVSDDFYNVVFISTAYGNDCLNFMLYGSYPQILIYSIPLPLIGHMNMVAAGGDDDAIINLYCNCRINGYMSSNFIQEDQIVGYLNTTGGNKYRSCVYIKNDLQFSSDLQDLQVYEVSEDSVGILLSNSLSGLLKFTLHGIPRPYVNLDVFTTAQCKNMVKVKHMDVKQYKNITKLQEFDKVVRNIGTFIESVDVGACSVQEELQICNVEYLQPFELLYEQSVADKGCRKVCAVDAYLSTHYFSCEKVLGSLNTRNSNLYCFQNGRKQLCILDVRENRLLDILVQEGGDDKRFYNHVYFNGNMVIAVDGRYICEFVSDKIEPGIPPQRK